MRKRKQTLIALVYDFDKTLCPQDMQNYSFIPAVGMKPSQFWGATNDFTVNYGVEKILSYMYVMIREAKKQNIKLSKGFLKSLGKDIEYFEGVINWFDRINHYASERGILLEHYILSSGTKEIIEGCAIAKHFKAIFGCEFHYDEETGEPVWPKFAINYTQKTQYLFRISKGFLDQADDGHVNKRVDKRIPFENIIYIGDGMTDVPCMTLVKEKGGHSIAVYPEGQKHRVEELYTESRVNMICLADYRPGKPIDRHVKLVIDSIKTSEALDLLEIETSEDKKSTSK